MNLDNEGNAASIEGLLKLRPYSIGDEEKNRLLLPIIKQGLGSIRNNPHLKSFFKKKKIDVEKIRTLEDVPYIPVQMFKYFDLSTLPKEQITRVLKSSGTTSGQPSRVPLSKHSAFNQTKALNSILSDYLGHKRMVFLVVDHEGINNPNQEITARTAGVRGLSLFAKKTFYLLKEVDGKLVLNEDAIREVSEKYSGEEVYVFGFTYIIWSVFHKQINGLKDKPAFMFKGAKVFHSGGWKKLEAEKVSKEKFNKEIGSIFKTEEKNIYDFYGMAEQTGIIFVDCEQGNKHVPVFSQIIIRDIQTQKPCEINKVGLIEVMSILSDSYYCQGILTEDKGYLGGIDGCQCGRKGRYFRFTSRLEKTELRGCGDTFRQRQ